MRYLSLLISFLALFNVVVAQSPHGDLKGKDCGSCHNPQNWIVDTKKLDFDHSTTKFPLMGQHSSVDCQTCHTTLKFEGTPVNCSSCHTSVHGNTLSNDCQTCHTPENWLVKEILPLHERSRFALFGAHQTADCGMCHQNYEVRKFEPVQTDCYSCHAKDYFATAVPNHPNGKFSTDCTMCHDVKAVNWRSSNINHEFFPLTGGHNRPSCYDCHNQGSFAGLSRECYSCHQPNYEAVKNPDHVLGNFSKQCQACHNINAWVPAQFDHNLTTFPLTGKHTSVQCASCHTQGYTGTPKACVSCHQTDYNATTNPKHTAASFPTTCESCHTTSGWQPAQFDHDGPFFPIYSGQHRGEWNVCSDCHKNPASYAEFTCTSCHEHNQNDMNSEHQGIQGYRWESSACYACHPTGDANGAFNHQTSPFPLTGAHVTTDCALCHTTGYANTPNDCYTCHQQGFNLTNKLNHTLAGFSQNCTQCHNTTAWASTTFNHTTTSGFPLQNSHAGKTCVDCHQTSYTTTSNECSSCHMPDFQGSTNPNHVAGNYPQLCFNCHTDVGWAPATFDHTIVNFPITGRHTTALCADCHTTGFTNTPNQCSGCHMPDFQGSTNPNHVAGQYPQTCQSCHTSAGWAPATFDHTIVNFPITGRHTTVPCADCHTKGFTNTPNQCSGCHMPDFQGTTNPNHVAGQYPQTCQSCHTSAGWAPATFDHTIVNFPITGRHTTVPCADCHTTGFTNTPNQCSGCHLDDYQTAQNPNHIGAQFPQTCATCHTSSGWAPATFEHDNQYFPINSGEHRNEWNNDCRTCHNVPTNYAAFTCIDCHEHNQTSMNQEHQGVQGYIYASAECFACHPDGTANGAFNHTTSQFPLTGNHLTLSCNQCHATGYPNTPNDCYSCHQTGYNLTNKLNHTLAGFSQNCTECHNTSGWVSTTFNHSTTTGFPLTNAHSTPVCSACHETTYTGTVSECSSCHIADYNSATNPNHLAPHFPTICSDCHTNSAWAPSTFNHDVQYFPIYSGEHRNEWNNNCLSCHTVPSNFASFSCIDCHEHNQTSMNQEHQGVANYSWNSQRCFECHPDGDSGPTLKQDHSFYPISGKHTSVTCNECHSSEGGKPQCIECHQEELTSAHKLEASNTRCWECHNTFSFDLDGLTPKKLERID